MNSNSGIGQQFTCKCGKTKGWIYDGEEQPSACPNCGRRYKGKYSRKTLQIEAIELRSK